MKALTDAEVDRLITEAAAGPGLRASWAGMLADRERHRAAMVALEAECAALAEALGDPAVTHEYVLYPRFPRRCDRVGCARPADAPVHQTPAEVRRRYGFGAS